MFDLMNGKYIFVGQEAVPGFCHLQLISSLTLCFIVHKEALLVILVSSHATGRHKEEDDKSLVCDKRDKPITCVCCDVQSIRKTRLGLKELKFIF